MPTTETIRITFDRPMDRQSVASRFHVDPSVPGQLNWPRLNELVFAHPPLGTDGDYEVVLDGGYRDALGNANGLRHHWSFHTEAAPLLTGSSPGSGDAGVDPASYIALSFTRQMDLSSLASAVSLTPGVRVTLRTDPADPRRVIVAPQSVLDPSREYTVIVTSDARDVDGNSLGSGAFLTFTTGPPRPLRHWLSFVAAPRASEGGAAPSDGIWIVDESRFPRQLAAVDAQSYAWSPDGTRLIFRGPDGAWSEAVPGGASSPLPLSGRWARFLAPGQGYASLDGGRLAQLTAAGAAVPLATGVDQAAVAPGGTRIAFTVSGAQGGSEIWVYDVQLRARYRLQVESGAASDLAWSPDGARLAWRLDTGDPSRVQIRARSLAAGGPPVAATVASGYVSAPRWQADSRHLIFSAAISSAAGQVQKAYRLSVTDPPVQRLDPGQGMPAGSQLDVEDPIASPDGHQIAFRAAVDGAEQVFLMNSDGTGLAQLTAFDPASFPYSCLALSWTPS